MALYHLRLNGVQAFVFSSRDGGHRITVSGWTPDHYRWQRGDKFILTRPSGETTRYRVTDVRRPGDPPDQYFMDMAFDPRDVVEHIAGIDGGNT